MKEAIAIVKKYRDGVLGMSMCEQIQRAVLNSIIEDLESAQQSAQAATNTCPYCGGTGKGKMNGIEVGCIMCSKTGRRQAAKT